MLREPARFDISSASIFELNDKASAGFTLKRTKATPSVENIEPANLAPTCKVSTTPLTLAPKGGTSYHGIRAMQHISASENAR